MLFGGMQSRRPRVEATDVLSADEVTEPGQEEREKRGGLTSSGFFSRSLALPCLGLESWPATAEILSIAVATDQSEVLEEQMRELSYHPSLWFCPSVRDTSGAWDRVTRDTLMLHVG